MTPLTTPVRQWRDGQWRVFDENISREELLRIHYLDEQAELWACPHHLDMLALGHIQLDCGHTESPNAPVSLHTGWVNFAPVEDGHIHGAYVTLGAALPPPEDVGQTHAYALIGYMKDFLDVPGLWHSTGCFHRAALLCLKDGHIETLHEDIGRHNCLDRLVGHCCMAGIHPASFALFVTARVTASLYAKARRAGLKYIVSRAAVTTASWQCAIAQDVTLVGFCRLDDERLTVFADTKARVSG